MLESGSGRWMHRTKGLAIIALVAGGIVFVGCGGSAPEHGRGRGTSAAARAAIWPPATGYSTLLTPRGEDGVLMVGGQARACWGSGLPDGGGAWTFDGERGWRHLADAPAARNSNAAAWDARARRAIVWFAFVTAASCDDFSIPAPVAETWAFDPQTRAWSDLRPSASPPAGLLPGGSPLAYDPRADKVVMFGGLDLVKLGALARGDSVPLDQLFVNDTWVYDFRTNRWTDMKPANPPPARNSHVLVYDARAGRIVLFGGGDAFQDFDDTWAYDVASNTWTNLDPKNHPSARAYAGLAHDPGSGKDVLFGGVDYDENLIPSETWTYDFAANTWELHSPPNSPSPRGWFAMAYDAAAEGVFLFGGGVDRFHFTNEAWLYRVERDDWMPLTP